ncbi:MAG TPA: hypothetical protein RMI62_16220, partial [Polyangiaceae bacterium LLY-WYZ-15_(1-7)]|nr:hypothetical protein [Polyangiaceae bacterium LLY-WYZ-15_(1-7)]
MRARFEEAAARAGAWEPFVDALGNRLTDEDVGDEESLALRRKLAEIQGEKLGETGEAIAQLEQILEAEPRDADVVAVLDRLYRSEGRTRDLRKLKVHRLQHVDDADERLAILRELAQLEEDVLDDAEGAAARYRTILEIEPTDPEALEALDRLLTQGERWEELAEVLKRRRELDDADRIGLTLRLATLEREKLGDDRGALDHYAEVMDARPSHPEAVAGVEALAEKDALKLLAAPLLERAYENSAEPEKLAGVLRLRLEATEDEEETRELRLRLAELAATSLGDADGAYAALEAAFLDRPSDVDLWDRLANAAEAAGKHEALATAFATAIEAGELPDGDRAALASRVAEIYDVILGEPAKAEPFHKKVLLDDPLHERAFLALKELYTTQERWDELQALYRNRIAETVDGEQKLELLLQVCFLFEEILEDPELAIRSYQEVLELEPEHYSTRRALDRLYRRTERWRDLVALLRQELDREEDERGKIDLLYEIGELHEQRLGEPTMAVDQYEQVLEKAPTHVKAQQALERLLGEPSQRQRIAATLEPLYDAQGAWGELARILEVQLEDVSDPGGQLALLTRIASLQEDKLGDAEKAMGALSKAVLADPQDASVRQELARVAGLRGADAERAAVLEKAAEQSADSTFLHAELLLELARLYDDQLGDLDAAERTYAKLIEVDGDNPDSVLPAARALERIHMGRDEHEKLAGDLRLQIKLEFDQEKRGELLLRLATLLEEVLEDTDGAIAAHRQRLDVDPADVSAMRSLERLYEQKGEWQKLIGVLQSREASIDDATEQEVVVQRIGEVYETKLEDLDNAIVAYNDALSRFGPHAETLVALARLYERGERWDDLLEILEMQEEQAEGEAAAELRFRRAQLMRTKTGDVERAIETYAEVLEVLPGHEGTITALEEVITDPEADYRVDAARTLVPHYEGAQAYGDLVAALEVVAESDDPLERLRSLRRAAEVAEVGAEDQAQAFALTAKAVRAGLGEPDLQDMLADLTRYAAAADKHVEHAAFLEEVAPDILDGDLQSAALLEAAAVVRARLEDRDRARALYTRVLENRPDHGGALDALDELHGEAEDWPALRDVLRRKTELAETAEERITLLERRAELDVEKLDDLPAAIDAYEQVLMEQEDRQSAYEALRRLYAKAERWTDLSATLERQLDAGVGNAVEVRHAIAEVSLEHLNDEYAALDQLREALAVDNTHAPSIALLEKIMEEREEHRGAAAEILEPVFLAQMDWPKVTATLDARLSSTDVLEERKAILAKLGQIHEDYLEDLEGALAVYGRLFREDVRDREVWETLERLGRVLDAQAELAGIYGGAIEEGGVVDEETAEVARKAGRLRAGLGESEKAVELWSRVIEFEPTDREAFQALEEAYRSLVSESKALAEAKQAEAEAPPPVPEAARASDPGVAPGEAAEESAEAAEGEAGEESAEAAEGEAAEESAEATEGEAEESAEAAEGEAEESAEAPEGEAEESAEAPEAAEPAEDPRVAAREAAREAEARAERWTESLLDLYRRRVDVAESDEERVQLLHRVADLQEDEAEVDAAIDAYRQALEHDPNDITAVEALDRLFTETERWPDLADHLRFRIDASMGGAEEADLKHRLAVLHVERLDDEVMAVDLLEEVLQADPTHTPSIQTLEGLVLKDELKLRITQILDPIYRGQDQWKKLVAVLEAQVEMTDDPVDRVRLLGEIAQLHEDRGQDGARAFEAWARAFASDPLDEGPQKELDRLAGLLDIWDEHVAAYEAALAKTTDPMRRSQLLGTMARVHDEKRGDPRAAIETYERLAENDPDDVSALDALEALHTMVADWRGLVEVIDRKVERSFEPAERAELLRRAASVLEELLGDPKGAIDLYERAAQEDDQDPVALEALDRLYAAHSEHEQLARVLRRRVEVEEDAELKVEIGLRLGQLHETQLQQPEDAIDAYVGVLDVESGQKDAIAALSRLYERQALWPELLENLKLQAGLAENVDERVAFMHRAGEVTERELDDVLEAITLYEQVLELDNRHEPALEALVRISQLEDYRAQAAEILEPLLHLQERWDLLADLKKLKADAALDPLDKKQELIALAEVRENGLQDASGAFDALARALGEDPSDEEIAENLER